MSNLEFKRIIQEIETESINADYNEGVHCIPLDNNLSRIYAVIKGPEDTPYENGYFGVEMKIPYEYPKMPTEFKFLTKIYHPNVDKTGRICAFDTWVDNWGESVALSTVLKSLRTILMQPNVVDPIDANIAMEILINNGSYEAKAREYTRKFASEQRVVQQILEKTTPQLLTNTSLPTTIEIEDSPPRNDEEENITMCNPATTIVIEDSPPCNDEEENITMCNPAIPIVIEDSPPRNDEEENITMCNSAVPIEIEDSPPRNDEGGDYTNTHIRKKRRI